MTSGGRTTQWSVWVLPIGVAALATATAVGSPNPQPYAGGVAVSNTARDDASSAPSEAVKQAVQISAPRVKELRDRVLGETLERDLLQATLGAPFSTDEIKSYYEKYLDRFVQPPAIDVWRILVGTETHAKELLARVEQSETPQKTWSLLAREHSIDKATHFRKGHLGFVRADGSTDVPQVRVSPSVYAAAVTLDNGAFTRTPVREGENWALVWRRGSRPEVSVTLDQAKGEIVQQLALAKARALLAQTLADLRRTHLSEHHPELVEAIPMTPDATISVPRRPWQPHPADGQPRPQKTDWGER